MSEKKWYKKGIRFKCQGSGKCCTSHGSYGYVYLSLEDRRAMSNLFNLTTGAFTKRYCDSYEGAFYLKEQKLENGEASLDCLFLKNNQCSVYKCRPTQCRTWPFWPDVMKSKIWKKDVMSFCPGINKGRLYTASEIDLTIEEQKKSEKEIFEL